MKYSVSGSSPLGSLIMQIMLFDMALETWVTLSVNREYFRHIYKIEQLIEVIFKLTAAANSNNLLNYFFVFSRPTLGPVHFIGHVWSSTFRGSHAERMYCQRINDGTATNWTRSGFFRFWPSTSPTIVLCAFFIVTAFAVVLLSATNSDDVLWITIMWQGRASLPFRCCIIFIFFFQFIKKALCALLGICILQRDSLSTFNGVLCPDWQGETFIFL